MDSSEAGMMSTAAKRIAGRVFVGVCVSLCMLGFHKLSRAGDIPELCAQAGSTSGGAAGSHHDWESTPAVAYDYVNVPGIVSGDVWEGFLIAPGFTQSEGYAGPGCASLYAAVGENGSFDLSLFGEGYDFTDGVVYYRRAYSIASGEPGGGGTPAPAISIADITEVCWLVLAAWAGAFGIRFIGRAVRPAAGTED